MNYILALAGVLGVSMSGPIMAATAAPALSIALWRNALGSAALGIYVGAAQRTNLRALTFKDYGWTAFSALALAGHFACWITSLKLTSVASATALVCMQVAWVAILTRLRGGRTSRRIASGLAVAIVGVFVITGFDFSLSTEALVGDLLAVAGGMFAALYVMAGAKLRRTMSTTTYAALCYGGSALVLLLLCLATGQPLWGFSVWAWAGIVGVTIVAQLVGHTVFNHLLAVMSPMVVSLIILLEVPGAALLAGVFLGQTPPAGTYLGLVFILAGLAVVVTGQQRPDPAKTVSRPRRTTP
ncbi:DMT family transporter [Arthrobacter sp. H14]|uniref:DMT family transporter n=1 Tax=Arthrobacter sp. H14 TaxID=1312959 RepID=UPI0004B41179|nr:DMT family transporter [Arthrobacter sp. H14]